MMFSHIVWSDKSCTLKEFVDEYPLPQLIKVESGVYNDDDARTLSAEQILTLHITKRSDKVLVRAAENKQYFLPVTCPYKVEILPKFCQDKYYSVEDITSSFTAPDFKFIRVVHNGPPSLRIRAGDILKLKKTEEENRVKYLECEFYNKTQDSVMLPLEFKAAFEPLASPEEYHLQEVLSSFTLPVRVKFTSSDTIIPNAANTNIELQSFGSVLLKEIREEITVIATSRDDETVTVLMIPSDLDVKVNPALGAVKGDSTYARFCKEIHDGTELSKIDLLNSSKLLEYSEEPTVDVVYDYVEIGPPLPPRSDSKRSEPTDSDEDYEDVDLPPPRPPKPSPKPNLRSAHQNEKTDGVFPSMCSRSYSSEKPLSFNEDGDDDSEDDDGEYEDFDPVFGSSDDEEDVYPQTDLPGAEMPSDRGKEKRSALEEPAKLNLKTRVSAILKKAIAKSPMSPPASRLPFNTYANIPTQRLHPPPQRQSPEKSLSTSPSPVASHLSQGYPYDLSSLSVSEVGECLKKLNLGEHVKAFENQTVDGSLLKNLSEQELIDLGVTKLFQRNKLLLFIQGWRPKMN